MGGTLERPNYSNYGNGGHSETVYIEYTDATDYQTLLDLFWESHEAAYHYTRPLDTAYKSIIFYQNEEQKALAEASLAAKRQAVSPTPVFTEVRDAKNFQFWPAETYHQKYYKNPCPGN
eukprot:JP437514.1.p1 GENE.JP437514.1~~JP437514.1.p1  ORF type:complete len:119 (-),score=31.72 JP437514.1:126-482(-)